MERKLVKSEIKSINISKLKGNCKSSLSHRLCNVQGWEDNESKPHHKRLENECKIKTKKLCHCISRVVTTGQ